MTEQPVGPHPVTLTVYNDDNSTLKSGAKCYIINTTKKTKTAETLTNASGIAAIDVANLPLGTNQSYRYEAGDVLLLVAYDGNKHDAKRYVVTGSSYSATLYLNPVPHDQEIDILKIKTLVLANTTSTVYYAKLWAATDGRLLLHMECPANDTRWVSTEISCPDGILIEREHQGLVVTAVIR